MVQRPFSEDNESVAWRNLSSHSIRFNEELLFPGVAQRKGTYHNLHRPRIATTMSSIDLFRGSAGYSKKKFMKTDPLADRLTRNTLTDKVNTQKNEQTIQYSRGTYIDENNVTVKNFYQIPTPSRFFPPVDDRDGSFEKNNNTLNTVVIPDIDQAANDNKTIHVTGILIPKARIQSQPDNVEELKTVYAGHSKLDDMENEKTDYLVEGISAGSNELGYNVTVDPYTCVMVKTAKTDIDAQERFCQFNIEVFRNIDLF